jgi:hypothetical protein
VKTFAAKLLEIVVIGPSAHLVHVPKNRAIVALPGIASEPGPIEDKASQNI